MFKKIFGGEKKVDLVAVFLPTPFLFELSPHDFHPVLFAARAIFFDQSSLIEFNPTSKDPILPCTAQDDPAGQGLQPLSSGPQLQPQGCPPALTTRKRV